MGTYMAGLPTEEYNKLQQKVKDAAATAGSQIAADKDMLESGAKGAV